MKLDNLLPINYQRETRDLCILYKCIHGYYDIDIRNHVMIGPHQRRTRSSRDSYRISIERYNTDKAMEFFCARTVKPWNAIPSNVRSINCNDKEIPHLRSWQIKHYNQPTESYFDVNNLCTWVSFCRCPSCRPVWVQSNNIVSLLPFLLTLHISYPILFLFKINHHLLNCGFFNICFVFYLIEFILLFLLGACARQPYTARLVLRPIIHSYTVLGMLQWDWQWVIKHCLQLVGTTFHDDID